MGAKAVWRYWRIGKAEPRLNAVMKRRGTAFAVRNERRYAKLSQFSVEFEYSGKGRTHSEQSSERGLRSLTR
jgi:hypothetical protein